MNIFGNACKYTTNGYIIVRLRVRPANDTEKAKNSASETLVLNVIDSGKGMSSDYMQRKLYTPFAQEDTFAVGVGLGLSIV